jgi:hypothetical protein
MLFSLCSVEFTEKAAQPYSAVKGDVNPKLAEVSWTARAVPKTVLEEDFASEARRLRNAWRYDPRS